MNTDRRLQIASEVSEVFQKYPGRPIPGPTLASLVVQGLNASPSEWNQACYDVTTYLEEEIKAGHLIRTKGKNGGISKAIPDLSFSRAIQQAKDLAINPTVVAAVNDHKCPCCGNDRCSKNERTCWKCGGSLH